MDLAKTGAGVPKKPTLIQASDATHAFCLVNLTRKLTSFYPVKDSSPIIVRTLDSKIAPAATRFAFSPS